MGTGDKPGHSKLASETGKRACYKEKHEEGTNMGIKEKPDTFFFSFASGPANFERNWCYPTGL